jgi:hypothetical protein
MDGRVKMMNYKLNILLKMLIISSLLTILSCEKQEEIITGFEYFPVEKGLFWEYDVAEEIYTVSAPVRKSNFQIRERVGESFEVANQSVFKLERYRRNDEKSTWKLDSVWTIQLNQTQAIRSENNVSFTKMIFPINEGEKWNSSNINSSQSAIYQYKNTFQKFDNKYFPTVRVVERNDSTAINLNRKYEVYAKQIGLVYKEFTTLEYCQKTPSCIGKGEVDFGTKRVFRLKNYGKE